jgi:hypothetical protein
VVFDDCPNGSAREIVEQLKDKRFHYRRNHRPLGAIGNIDQCFRNQPFAEGSYACVVEDDNFLLPRHLKCQLTTCIEQHVDVTFSAQLCENVIVPGEPGELTEAKTIAWIYPKGAYEFREMLPAILFSHAFSNGSAFWRIGRPLNFEVGGFTRNPGVQETSRILGLKSDVYVSHEPTAVWRSNDPRDSYVRKTFAGNVVNKWKDKWCHLIERREVMELRLLYIRNHGINDAVSFSARFGLKHQENIERSLLLCGKYVVLTDRSLYWRMVQLMRGLAFKVVVPSRLNFDKAQIDWIR